MDAYSLIVFSAIDLFVGQSSIRLTELARMVYHWFLLEYLVIYVYMHSQMFAYIHRLVIMQTLIFA